MSLKIFNRKPYIKISDDEKSLIKQVIKQRKSLKEVAEKLSIHYDSAGTIISQERKTLIQVVKPVATNAQEVYKLKKITANHVLELTSKKAVAAKNNNNQNDAKTNIQSNAEINIQRDNKLHNIEISHDYEGIENVIKESLLLAVKDQEGFINATEQLTMIYDKRNVIIYNKKRGYIQQVAFETQRIIEENSEYISSRIQGILYNRTGVKLESSLMKNALKSSKATLGNPSYTLDKKRILYYTLSDKSDSDERFITFINELTTILDQDQIVNRPWIIPNNTRTHGIDKIEKLLPNINYQLKFLSPYSYMLNPAEQSF
ncbi:hypothetical protein K502DRAFT_350349 [Neoconidiobolus thromboides FSU 785]|nr:hypothetical protein K502DRAFT_350349 [Neoconidiobolus thromboides FSU 785]